MCLSVPLSRQHRSFLRSKYGTYGTRFSFLTFLKLLKRVTVGQAVGSKLELLRAFVFARIRFPYTSRKLTHLSAYASIFKYYIHVRIRIGYILRCRNRHRGYVADLYIPCILICAGVHVM